MNVSKDRHRQYLARTARELSKRAGVSISPRAVLEALLDLAIADEGVYDPLDGRPLSAGQREIGQAKRASRTQQFGSEQLLGALGYED